MGKCGLDECNYGCQYSHKKSSPCYEENKMTDKEMPIGYIDGEAAYASEMSFRRASVARYKDKNGDWVLTEEPEEKITRPPNTEALVLFNGIACLVDGHAEAKETIRKALQQAAGDEGRQLIRYHGIEESLIDAYNTGEPDNVWAIVERYIIDEEALKPEPVDVEGLNEYDLSAVGKDNEGNILYAIPKELDNIIRKNLMRDYANVELLRQGVEMLADGLDYEGEGVTIEERFNNCPEEIKAVRDFIINPHLTAGDAWQPIETAPIYQDVLLVTTCGTIVTGRKRTNGYELIGTDWPIGEVHKPTHWQPLPAPPKEAGGEA